MRERSSTDFQKRDREIPGNKARRSATVLCPSIDVVEGVLQDMVLGFKGQEESYPIVQEDVLAVKQEGQTQSKQAFAEELQEQIFEEECHDVKLNAISQKENDDRDKQDQEEQQQYEAQNIVMISGKEKDQSGTEAEDEQKQFDDRSPCRPQSCNTSMNKSFEHVHKPLKDLIYKTNKEFYDVDSHKVKYKAGLSKRSAMLPSLHRKKKPSD